MGGVVLGEEYKKYNAAPFLTKPLLFFTEMARREAESKTGRKPSLEEVWGLTKSGQTGIGTTAQAGLGPVTRVIDEATRRAEIARKTRRYRRTGDTILGGLEPVSSKKTLLG